MHASASSVPNALSRARKDLWRGSQFTSTPAGRRVASSLIGHPPSPTGGGGRELRLADVCLAELSHVKRHNRWCFRTAISTETHTPALYDMLPKIRSARSELISSMFPKMNGLRFSPGRWRREQSFGRKFPRKVQLFRSKSETAKSEQVEIKVQSFRSKAESCI